MRVLIVGCGYVGLPLGAELVGLGHAVAGLRRSASADAELRGAGITPLHGDITRPETLAQLPANFDWVVNCAASGGGGPAEYRELYVRGNQHLSAWLASARVRKFVYTSSTAVYGQNDGAMVTEESATEPEAETARVLVEAEHALLRAVHDHSLPAVILRVAGIYGPGRGYLLKQFLRGEARIEGAGGRCLNMIHRDDLIRAIIAALERGQPGHLYNVVDSEPVLQREFFAWLAGKLERPLPPTIPPDQPLAHKRGLTNKQVSNRKLRAELGVDLRYPDFRAGYAEEIQRLTAAGELAMSPVASPREQQ